MKNTSRRPRSRSRAYFDMRLGTARLRLSREGLARLTHFVLLLLLALVSTYTARSGIIAPPL